MFNNYSSEHYNLQLGLGGLRFYKTDNNLYSISLPLLTAFLLRYILSIDIGIVEFW